MSDDVQHVRTREAAAKYLRMIAAQLTTLRMLLPETLRSIAEIERIDLHALRFCALADRIERNDWEDKYPWPQCDACMGKGPCSLCGRVG